ncbi:hypothetical protein [Pseudofulvibacter geojedonensis]|uniref:Zinc-ribbon 15 domain-containing protein n=1 Tax=Pseudofulvibacter geojedonensis TaxID=1123758 RepID=A0ABW3I298_9FLAO
MIIYGHNSSDLGSSKPNSLKCPSCENTGTTTLYLFGKYATLFWVPMFPMGKKMISECSHCKVVMEKKQMPPEFNLPLQNLKDQSKTPIWNWTGLVIVTGIIIFGLFQSKQHDTDVITYIQQPVAKDLYDVKLEDGNYTTFKVTNVENDSIYFRMNDYVISRSSKLYKIDKDENYSDEIFSMHKSKLKELFDSGDIIDISRN